MDSKTLKQICNDIFRIQKSIVIIFIENLQVALTFKSMTILISSQEQAWKNPRRTKSNPRTVNNFIIESCLLEEVSLLVFSPNQSTHHEFPDKLFRFQSSSLLLLPPKAPKENKFIDCCRADAKRAKSWEASLSDLPPRALLSSRSRRDSFPQRARARFPPSPSYCLPCLCLCLCLHSIRLVVRC